MASYFQDYRQLLSRFSAGEGRAALEDLDGAALAALTGVEREEAIAVLRAHLEEGHNDPRALRALVVLRPPDLGDLLRREIRRSVDETGVAAAVALWETEHAAAGPEALCRILQKSHFESARQAAAAALALLPADAPVDAALLAALDDESAALRDMATSVLLQRAGIGALETRARSKISRLGGLLLNPLLAVRGPAAAELREILAALHAGASAEELGLLPTPGADSPALCRLRDSIAAAGAVDGGALRELSGEERRRGEQLLLGLIGKGDRRGVRAAAMPEGAFALAALREFAAGSKGRAAEEAQGAIRQIEAAQQTEEAQLVALDAEEATVRLEAARALLARLGLSEQADAPRTRVHALLQLLGNPIRSVRRRAMADLIAIRTALCAGQPAQALDLAAATRSSAALDRLTAQAMDSTEELDLALLKGLQPEERLWAEHLLYHLLSQRDARGIRAVVALGAKWAAPALRELAEEDGEFAAAAKKALGWLA